MSKQCPKCEQLFDEQLEKCPNCDETLIEVPDQSDEFAQAEPVKIEKDLSYVEAKVKYKEFKIKRNIFLALSIACALCLAPLVFVVPPVFGFIQINIIWFLIPWFILLGLFIGGLTTFIRLRIQNNSYLSVLKKRYNEEDLSSAFTEEEKLEVERLKTIDRPYILPCENPKISPIEISTKNKVLNILWIIFVGVWAAGYNAISGAILCMTIIGIPAGISCFKIIPLVFAPAGREAKLYYGKFPILNTLNVIFGGVEQYIISCIIGGLLCATIIGIPFGLQLFKIAKFHLAPFGAEIVYTGAYTSKMNHYSDYKLLFSHIRQSKEPVTLSDGSVVAPYKALKIILTKQEKDILLKSVYSGKTTIELLANSILSFLIGVIFAAGMFVLFDLLINAIKGQSTISSSLLKYLPIGLIFVGAILALLIIIIPIAEIVPNIRKYKLMKIFEKKIAVLATYYPNIYKPNEENKAHSFRDVQYIIQNEIARILHLY